MIIIGDPHFGLTRKSGATSESMRRMAEHNLGLLPVCHGEDLLIVGDLFASYDVSTEALLAAWQWLQRWNGKVRVLQGNHDISKDRTRLSSLAFLGKVLDIDVITEPIILGDVAYVPHLANQALFDAAVEEVAKTAAILVTHANFENQFAAEKDHSLNLTKAQTDQFEMVISGHEHDRRVVGNVHMLGSPYPCQIGEAQVDHFYHTWDEENAPVPVLSWASAEEGYMEVDWQDVKSGLEAQYLRVTGSATAEQATAVIQEVTKLRAHHSAFFITNSVKVGSLEAGALDDISEDLETFDPVGLLKSLLSEDYRKRLEELTR